MNLTPRSYGNAIVPLRSVLVRKWNAEGLRSDGDACNRTVLFQKIERLKRLKKIGTIRNRSVPFPSKQTNGKHVNGTIAFSSEHKAKLVRNRSRNWSEDRAERLRSRVNKALI